MGWASASTIMDTVIEHVHANVTDPEIRKKIYGPIHEELRNGDWDTVDECLGKDPAYDAYVRENEPQWFSDGEDDE